MLDRVRECETAIVLIGATDLPNAKDALAIAGHNEIILSDFLCKPADLACLAGRHRRTC